MLEMRVWGWMIWMAMLMNVVEAEQEDEVDHTDRCQQSGIALPFNLDFFVFFLFPIVYCLVHLIYNMIG
jgi:hypothetical protein